MKRRHVASLLSVASLLAGGCSSRDAVPSGSGMGGEESKGSSARLLQATAESTDEWFAGTTEEAMLHNLRAHYREAAVAARAVKASASTEAVRSEAEWLIVIYDHVAEHFDTSLRDWYGPQAEQASDPALSEFTDPNSVSPPGAREKRFAEEVSRSHTRLMSYVKSPVYQRFAANRPLLREIQIDVETSQAVQVTAFMKAVEGK